MFKQYERIFPIAGDYPSLCLREFLSSNLTQSRSCLILGCGPLPLTAVIFSILKNYATPGTLPDLSKLLCPDIHPATTETESRNLFDLLFAMTTTQPLPGWCTCIDRDPRAVESAAAVLRRIELAEAIYVTAGTAEEFPTYGSFDVIHLAAMLADKKTLIRKIAKELRPGAQLIVRFPAEQSLQSLLYETLSQKDIESLTCENNLVLRHIFQPPPGINIVTGFLVFEKALPHA